VSIEIVAVGPSIYRVTLMPPQGTWTSDRELTATEVIERLSERGCHSTDVTDALDATGNDWRPAHDEEVRQRRDPAG
jgi:hypothetical protein